jgi:hypothetical protein
MTNLLLVHETHLLYTLRPEQLTGWKGNNGTSKVERNRGAVTTRQGGLSVRQGHHQ